MKKLLLLLLLATATLSCSVEPIEDEKLIVPKFDIETIEAQYDATAVCGSDIYVEVCSNAINNPTVLGFRNFYRAQIMLYSSLPTNGTFNPTMETLLAQYQQGETYLPTDYTVVAGDCGTVTIEIAAQIIQSRNAEAGTIADLSGVCTDQPVIDLNSLVGPEAIEGGVFTAAPGVLDGSTFDPAIGAGTYTITYTVDKRVKCVEGSDSISFTISVSEGYKANDISKTLCSSQINNPTLSGFSAYYKNQIILHTNLPTNGSWNPSMQQLLNQFNQEGGTGIFTSTYTIDTKCGLYSVEVAVDVQECN
ncbi:hypothetical protein [Salinimicrobium sp. HB62]|uniref:hypothetical protein n=1 Tax=Salinimicrobium sp. HB62 TaxID=3077781 RepID=UPI002D76A2D1|nr:hypothetical protein [Salinimicrobium sp. HB62]